MLPSDRLTRAGATSLEIAQLESLPEDQQRSIADQLAPVAETGVRDFIDTYRRSQIQPEPEEGDPVDASDGEPPPHPRRNRSHS